LIDTAIPLFERLDVANHSDVQHKLCQAEISLYIKGLYVCFAPTTAHSTSTLHRGDAAIPRWCTKLARHVQQSFR